MPSALAIADILPNRPVAEQSRRAPGAPPSKSFGDALADAGRDVERPKPDRPDRPRDHEAHDHHSNAGEAHRSEPREVRGDRPGRGRGGERSEGAVGRPDHARKGEARDKSERPTEAGEEPVNAEAAADDSADAPVAQHREGGCSCETTEVEPEAAAVALTADVVALAEAAPVPTAAPASVVLPVADILAVLEIATAITDSAAEALATPSGTAAEAAPVAAAPTSAPIAIAAAISAPVAPAEETAAVRSPAATSPGAAAEAVALDAARTAEDASTTPDAAATRGEAAAAPLRDPAAHAPTARFELASLAVAAGPAAEALAASGPSPSPTGAASAAPQSAAGSAPTPQNAMARADAPVPLQALAVEVGMRAMRGSKEFQIRLDPEDLGRIDVRLEISEKGEVQAKIAVERVETLQLLQRDARTLERAFDQAGLKTNPDGLQFTLKDPGQQGREQGRGDNAPGRRGRGDDAAIDDLPAISAIYRAPAAGGLDIRI